MGEGGTQPDYFLYRMQWWEVNRYLAGLRRRYHPLWENTRALQWWLACMFTDSKKSSPPNTPQQLYQFGWEQDKHRQTRISEQEAAELQQLISAHKW